jgi:hypothetical protein
MVDGKRPRDWNSGRRTSFTDAWGVEVLAAVAEGAPLSHVLKRPGMPSPKAFYRWLRNDPNFRAGYQAACEMRRLELFNRGLEVVVLATDAAATRKAVREARRLERRAGRMAPRKYRRQ